MQGFKKVEIQLNETKTPRAVNIDARKISSKL